MESIHYTKEMLSEMGVYQLRQIAWKLGLRLPTTFKKYELIDKILDLQEHPQTVEIEKTKKGRPIKNFLIDETSWFRDDFIPDKKDKTELKTSWEMGDWVTEFSPKQEVGFAVFQPEHDESLLQNFSGVFVREKNGCGTVHFGNLNDIVKSEVVSISALNTLQQSLRSGENVKGNMYVLEDGQKKPHIFEGYGIYEDNFKKNVFEELDSISIKEVLPLWQRQSLIFTKYFSPIGKGQRVVVFGAKKSGKTSLLSNMAEEFASNGVHVIYLSLDKRPECFFNFNNSNIENVFVPFDIRPFHQVYIFQLVFERAKRFCEAGKDVAVFVDDYLSAVCAYDNYIATKYEDDKNTSTIAEIKKYMACAKNSSQGGSLTVVGCFDTQKEQSETWMPIFEEICNCRIYLDKNLKLISPINVLPNSSTDSSFENMPKEFLEKGDEIRFNTFGKSLQDIAVIYKEKMK